MDPDKVRITSFIFMVGALALISFSLYFSFALTVELQNLVLTMSVLFFMLGNTGLLYTILDKLEKKD
ncbi:MAG: hypothetical protein ACLFN5_01465 [bacterium]